MPAAIGMGIGIPFKTGVGGGAASLMLVTHGDSITSDSHPTADPTKNWSRILATAITARTGQAVTLQQRGIGGHSWNYAWGPSGNPNTLMQDAVINVDPYVSATALLAIFAGTNGLTLNGRTPAQEAADADTYIAARLAAGWVASNIYVLTMLPRESYAYSKQFQYCQALETICNTRGCKIVRLHEDGDIGFPEQQFAATWFADQIHPTILGHQAIAELVYDVMVPTAWTAATLVAARPGLSLAVHLDAQDATTLTTDAGGTVQAIENDAIQVWKDKSGNAFNAVQASATARPAKKTYQSYPGVYFDGWGTSDTMQSATINSGLPSNNYAMFVVGALGVSENQHFLSTSSDNATEATGLYVTQSNGQVISIQDTGSRRIGAQTTWRTPPSKWASIAAVVRSVDVSRSFINGGDRKEGGTASTTAQAKGYKLGAPYGSTTTSPTGFMLKGYIGEMVWVSGQMLSVDARRIIAWLHSKWGISATPARVTFTPVTGATAGAAVTSNTITISGLGTDDAVRVAHFSNINISINGVAFVDAFNSGRALVNGDTLQLRMTASATSGATVEGRVSIGNQFHVWSVTTA
jgi:lysophospholipase L1-like esterase